MKKVAALQMCSGVDVSRNMHAMGVLIESAARRGAKLVVTPEGATYMGPKVVQSLAVEDLAQPGVVLTQLRAQAAQLEIDLLACVWLAADVTDKVFNALVHISPSGEIGAVYKKIHLFDALLEDGNTYDESNKIVAGKDVLTVDTACGKVGLSICYDVRFPELYRKLSSQGADILVVPAAFTVMTGKDHWHTLLRARAIENQAYVIAPAQVGTHYRSRASFGHTLICDAWGNILKESLTQDEEAVVAEIDDTQLEAVRRKLPSLKHRVL